METSKKRVRGGPICTRDKDHYVRKRQSILCPLVSNTWYLYASNPNITPVMPPRAICSVRPIVA